MALTERTRLQIHSITILAKVSTRVSIPKGHVFGSIGSSRTRRWVKRVFSGTDDRLKVIDLSPCSGPIFEKSIAERLQEFDPEERSVVILYTDTM
jgi:hypothetical protein